MTEKIQTLRQAFVASLLTVFATFTAPQILAQENENQQESRIDFGNAYIQGQSIKSGAVYLTNRRKSKIKSLLKTRESYRYEIVKDFYGGEVELKNSEVIAEENTEQQLDK